MGKEEIFSKFNVKDYNNELEKVLETKTFSEEVQNLLLSIFYKIDIAYNDFSIVKVQTQTKKEIMEEIINIIKNECDGIEIIRPKISEISKGEKYKILNEINKIFTYPNANILMSAIYALTKKKFKVRKSYGIIKEPMENMLNIGWQINKTEIIRDFDRMELEH